VRVLPFLNGATVARPLPRAGLKGWRRRSVAAGHQSHCRGELSGDLVGADSSSTLATAILISGVSKPDRGQEPLRLAVTVIYAEHCARMTCAVSTGVPRRDQHPRPATAATDERPRQGRRNPDVAAPDHGALTATARRTGPVRPSGSGLARGPAAPATANCTESPAATGTPGDRAALAPRSDRPPACPEFPAPPVGRPRTIRSIRRLVLRLVWGDSTWGYRDRIEIVTGCHAKEMSCTNAVHR
jgi:hypothetical protein